MGGPNQLATAWSYAGRRVTGFDELLRCYGASEFKSPRRSTVPLLAYWKAAEQSTRAWSEMLGFVPSGRVGLDFEHEVPVQRGKGGPSCTDLRLTAGDVSVAIEAKSTEGRYEDVTTWLSEPASRNRLEVLTGWLDLFRNCTSTKIRLEDVARLPYQVVHRAASACYGDAERRWLVYQVFNASPSKWKMYLDDLGALAGLLGDGASLKICMASCVVAKTDRQIELERMWDEGSRYLRGPVLDGLRHGNLIRVHLEKIVAI